MPSHIQAVLLDKKRFKTTKKANDYVKTSSFKPIKPMHETDDYYRYRLREPNNRKYTYRIKRNPNGIHFIIGFPKPKGRKTTKK
jgi:adenylate cyclase class IV